VRLEVDPLVGPADEPVAIRVSDVPPASKVRLICSTCLPWAVSAPFHSEAWFTADERGIVDPSRQRPDAGSYDFIDPMGLIASLRLESARSLKDIARNISVEKHLRIEIAAECDGETSSVTLERRFVREGIARKRISQPFVGEFFSAANADDPTVVFLGGSGGDLGPLLLFAALLASHHLNVLAVAYFKEKGLPAQLSRIPLEYFEGVFAWLADEPLARGDDVRLIGMSKGGELALLLASRHACVTKVVGLAPHAYCFQGIDFTHRASSWTHRGEELPYIRLRNSVFFGDLLGCFLRNGEFGYAHTYRRGLQAATNKEEARIRVEDAEADLLLFAGERDNVWNAGDGCREIIEALRQHDYPRSYEFIDYEDAGHPFGPCYVIPPGETAVLKVAPRLRLSQGGTLQGNAHAQADSWRRSVEFLGGRFET